MVEKKEITPITHPLQATLTVPGSKSITNRALPLAALAVGSSVLKGVLFSDDTHHFINCLQVLGFHLEVDEDTRVIVVHGQGGQIPNHSERVELFVGNSGTTARFLTAMLALGNRHYRVDGVDRMRQRPIQDQIKAMQQLGVDVESEHHTGCPPLVIKANGIRGGRASIVGKNSSQYLSALLMVAPYAQNTVELTVEGELLSSPYIQMTVQMMHDFGVTVIEQNRTYRIVAGQSYQDREYQIEPDASSASYLFAAPAIVGGQVRVNHLSATSMQGDAQFPGILEKMGCLVEWGSDFITISGPPDGELKGIDIDLNEMSDTTMTLAAIAPFASSPTTIRNIGHIRIKETDRIHATVTELKKLGVRVEEWEDGMRIYPAHEILPAEIETYDDHRMAMAFSLIGLRVPGIVILNHGCVSKTFPNYFDVLDQLRTS